MKRGKTLDGRRIRIKGSDVVTRVRFCSRDDDGNSRVVTEMSCLNSSDDSYPGARQFVSESNPYADFFLLDEIELQKGDGTWYSPEFKIGGPK